MLGLLNGQKTEVLTFNIKGKKSQGRLYYHAEEKRVRIEFVAQEFPVIGKCPKCQGDVIETEKYYICKEYKKTCNFVFGKTTYGAKVNTKEAQKVLNGEETKTFTFKFDKGKTGKGQLYYDVKEQRVRIKFEGGGNAKEIGNCPCCGGVVRVTDKFVKCDNYKKSCQFIFQSKPFEVKLTESEIQTILSGGYTDVKTLTYKNGNTGKGQLYYDKDEMNLKIKFQGGKEVLGKCVRCNQSEIYEGKNYYLCKNYKNPCTFIMSKQHREQAILPEQVKRLLQGEEVGIDWTTPDGHDYTDILYFDEGYLKVRR